MSFPSSSERGLHSRGESEKGRPLLGSPQIHDFPGPSQGGGCLTRHGNKKVSPQEEASLLQPEETTESGELREMKPAIYHTIYIDCGDKQSWVYQVGLDCGEPRKQGGWGYPWCPRQTGGFLVVP